MILPRHPPDATDVARHYDELDFFYRRVWGEHLHHGLWTGDRDRSPVEVATERLRRIATAPLAIRPGHAVVDIGSGYGAGARWIAERFGAEVTALTLSRAQATVATDAAPPGRGRVRTLVRDWLQNDLPDESFQAAVAIESLAHMPDKAAFFRQLARTLAPGGRAAIACWTAAPDPSPLERRLLETICEEGRLPGLGTLPEYLALATRAGLAVSDHRDLGPQVEPTWWIITRRVAAGLLTSPQYLRFLLRRLGREKLFVLTLPRLLLACRTGALGYGVLWLAKPSCRGGPSDRVSGVGCQGTRVATRLARAQPIGSLPDT